MCAPRGELAQSEWEADRHPCLSSIPASLSTFFFLPSFSFNYHHFFLLPFSITLLFLYRSSLAVKKPFAFPTYMIKGELRTPFFFLHVYHIHIHVLVLLCSEIASLIFYHSRSCHAISFQESVLFLITLCLSRNIPLCFDIDEELSRVNWVLKGKY